MNLATRRIETNGASVQLPDIEDVETLFLFECWRDCNRRVLELQQAPLQKGLFALCVCQFSCVDRAPTSEFFELQSFRQLVKLFVLQWMLLDRAVAIISEEHFSGMPVLYEDTAAILQQDLETATEIPGRLQREDRASTRN